VALIGYCQPHAIQFDHLLSGGSAGGADVEAHGHAVLAVFWAKGSESRVEEATWERLSLLDRVRGCQLVPNLILQIGGVIKVEAVATRAVYQLRRLILVLIIEVIKQAALPAVVPDPVQATLLP